MTQKERCDHLYEFLVDFDGWIRQEAVFAWLPISYPMTGNVKNPHNSTARRVLTRDIAYINASPEYEKVIIHGDQGVKIATEEEATRFFGAKKAELARAFHALRTFGKKIGLNGQMDLDELHVRLKIAGIEFEAIGSAEDVEKQRVLFLSSIDPDDLKKNLISAIMEEGKYYVQF